MRFTSSTQARIVWPPALADQVLAPLLGPLLAVSVTLCPGAKDCVSVSDQFTVVPSTANATPMITPAGVATVPWFFTVAENVAGREGATPAGETLVAVTTRSGAPVTCSKT